MNDTVESKERQFFFSQFKCIRTITLSEKRKIEQIFYEPRQMPCVMKTYYSRDLSEVYQKLKAIRHENLAVIYDILFCDGNTYVIEENIDALSQAISSEHWIDLREFLQQVCMMLSRAEYDFVHYEELQTFKSLLFDEKKLLMIKEIAQ